LLADVETMATTDFVMPKPSLTTTEGAVARRDVPYSGRFQAGDVIVVVETNDYDVKAPRSALLEAPPLLLAS
jgi:hypothetical protein